MQRRLWALAALVYAVLSSSVVSPLAAQAPLEVLYLTDYSAFWHDYDTQASQLIEALQRRANVRVTLVGKQQADTLQTLDQPGFAAGFDAVIYNVCLPNEDDLERIENAIRETTERGVPAMLLHCAAHSFRVTSPSTEAALDRRIAKWNEEHPGRTFPSWWQFHGIDSVRHDQPRALNVNKVQEHPIVRGLPARFRTTSDELYRVESAMNDLNVLYAVDSVPVVWTRQAGAARTFVSTLGHGDATLKLDVYQDLLARGLLWITGRLASDGQAIAGYAGNLRFENYQHTILCQPSDIVEATNVAEVQESVRRAALAGKRVKAVSLPTSNSNSRFICPEQGGVLLNLHRMNRVLALDEQRMTVTVEPGVRMNELSAFLHARGYAVTTMPDYTGVSVAGGMATGAHNSSLRFANAIADLAVSMTIVDGLGNLRVLRGADLATGAVHMGLLGVVVEVALQIVPQYKLRYGHESGSDRDLEQTIVQMVSAHDYAKVMWFAGNKRFVVDYYDRVPVETRGKSRHNLWSSTAGVFRTLGDTPYRLLNALPQRAQCDAELLRASIWLPPIDAKESPRDKPVGYSHEILASTCAPGKCPWDGQNVQSRTMEIAFPVARLTEWMGDVRNILDENRGCFPILGLYLRFLKASDRALGLNYGVDTVSFEIHVPKDATETTFEKSSAVYDEIVQLTLAKYAGRPHWGKNSPPDFAALGKRQFPAWDAFLSMKAAFDPRGLFDNEQWRAVKDGAPTLPYAGCTLTRDCVCDADLDCGAGFACQSGGYFEQARVCR